MAAAADWPGPVRAARLRARRLAVVFVEPRGPRLPRTDASSRRPTSRSSTWRSRLDARDRPGVRGASRERWEYDREASSARTSPTLLRSDSDAWRGRAATVFARGEGGRRRGYRGSGAPRGRSSYVRDVARCSPPERPRGWSSERGSERIGESIAVGCLRRRSLVVRSAQGLPGLISRPRGCRGLVRQTAPCGLRRCDVDSGGRVP